MKKFLISIVSICCVFLNVFNASAYAKPDSGIDPQAIAFPCSYCNTGTAILSSRVHIETINQRKVQCVHENSGTDTIGEQADVKCLICNSCGKHEVYQIVEIYVTYLIKCSNGYLPR